jgi:hypothetical protein
VAKVIRHLVILRFTNALVLQQHIRLHTGEPTDLTPDQIRAAEVRDYFTFPTNAFFKSESEEESSCDSKPNTSMPSASNLSALENQVRTITTTTFPDMIKQSQQHLMNDLDDASGGDAVGGGGGGGDRDSDSVSSSSEVKDNYALDLTPKKSPGGGATTPNPTSSSSSSQQPHPPSLFNPFVPPPMQLLPFNPMQLVPRRKLYKHINII